ncbi:MAG: hypothetical protein PHH54_05425 [Candidatus Nanoarchaeia archaeon]|nr:hypothetical protein [Candidatus Nanoarchaeia archaeon]MDD5741399.1 hypothetical protein [Candidatus Nanoarchaeia archaeon]
MSGIVGVYSVDGKNVADELLMGVVALQHRGEEGCGISVERKPGFYTPKERKLAYYFFRDFFGGLKGLREKTSSFAIGHTLYEDSGGLQPVEEWGEKHLISVAMDGVLLGFGGKNDSVMRALFSRYLDETSDFYDAGNKLMEKLRGKGSYCVVSLVKDKDGGDTSLVAFRDPKGIKPYCLGKKEDKYIVASESKSLDGIEADFIRDIEPGEMIVINKNGLSSKKLVEDKHAHCFFEWIYFADPTSVIEGKDVLEVRKELGRRLARRYVSRVDVDLVMASPDSGRGVAIGFQQELSKIKNRFIPYEEAAIKNPGSKRTFQVENEEERKLAANVKFFMNKKVVQGKNVAVGDDSIVRGTVFRDGMIYKLRKSKAEKIYPIISCPALLHACITDPRGRNFAAYGLKGTIEEIGEQVAKEINADFVCYPTVKDMIESVGLEDICKACIDGEFPVNEEFWK